MDYIKKIKPEIKYSNHSQSQTQTVFAALISKDRFPEWLRSGDNAKQWPFSLSIKIKPMMLRLCPCSCLPDTTPVDAGVVNNYSLGVMGTVN